MDRFVLIAAGAYLAIVLIVTRGVLLDPGLSPFQKLAQTTIVWLVPVFGMTVVLLMQGNNHTRDEMKTLVPFPFYLAASTSASTNGSLASPPHDGYDVGCGADAADGD